jgi:hypothetical protein
MNDDLNVLITMYSEGTLLKVAVSVKHGINNFADWEYFHEEDIKSKWNEIVPMNCRNFEICEIEEIYMIQG